ncbi:heparinase II/III family protein [Sporichthya sp.]|uniref:heparinase II/III domain-containing protein n=1 Tax=Sporichthya sp. TaxID=65475 RepID=UPI0017A12042|nr:heparinase II/III family protein [Sporichthya sp.]MBA3742362.1 heparinase II/III family protein [Sporichthya sp.]
MRRLGVALATAATLAAGTVVGISPPAVAASVALGGCGWQPTLARMNNPTSIRDGVLRLSGYAPVAINLTGDINWSTDPYQDPTWRLWFHSLKWMESLVVSGDPDDLALARQIVTDFVADNPDPGSDGGAWVDHATSFRTSLFVCMWHKGTGPAFRAWLEPILRAHAQVVLNRYVGAWNHGTMQSLALLAAGCTLDEATWQNVAASRLQNELVQGIDSQGAILEQAPGYASFIQGLHRDAAAHLAACDMPVPAGVYDRVELVDTYAAQATRPDGTFIEIGDTWPERPGVGMGPNSRWVVTRGAQGTMPADLVKVYNAGYVFARDSWTAPTQQYSLRFGPGRYTHGHNDHLSITYWAKGRDVLVDPGYDGYADRPFRTWSRSLQAHNVPIPNGAKYNADAPTALVARSAGKGARSWQLRDRAFAGAERHRSVLVDDQQKLMLVRDDVTADRARNLQILWHLDPSWSKERVVNNGRNTTATFLSANGRYRTSIIQLAAPGTTIASSATSVVKGRRSPTYQGYVSRHRGDRTPSWVLEVRRGAAKKQSVITLIVVTRVGEKVRAAWNKPKGKNRVRVTVGTTTKVYDSTRRGGLSAR